MREAIMGLVRGMRDMIPGGGREERNEKPVPPEELYRRYVTGRITQSELFHSLDPKDLDFFVEFHREEMSTAGVDVNPDRGSRFRMNQLDNLIERGILEQKIHEYRGISVVRRQDNRD